MKKILVCLLAAAMVFSMIACTGTGSNATEPTQTTAPAAKGTQVGFTAVNIVPDFNIGLQGFGNENERIFTGELKTYIYAMILAITDENDNTALIISVDAGGIGGFEKTVRQEIANQYGIPKENMLVHAIHQHSTPVFNGDYTSFVTKVVADGVQDALDDRAPAEMYLNTRETVALNFVRNYWTKDGTIYGPNYGTVGSGLDRHESDADNEMRLIKFVREGKQPIILVNFQTHPLKSTSATDTAIGADWPGAMRDIVAEELNAHVMYISGAGGNLDSTSNITEENVSTDWKDHAKRAANVVIKAEDSYEKAELGEVKSLTVTNTYNTDHSMDHLLEIATIVENIRLSEGLSAGHAAAKQYPELHSVYHAKNIVTKAALEPTTEVTLGAIAIGDVVFTIQPYEVFDTNGKELREGTVGNANYAAEDQLENPYKMTCVCSLANGHLGYVPSQLGYTNGGYATDITKLAPGSGELLVGDLLHLLQDLHG